jgi:hypothetical protein
MAASTASKQPMKAKGSKSKSKSALIQALLSRPSGASLAVLMKLTGWQSHSVRGFLAGSLKRKGIEVRSDSDTSGVRRYRIAGSVQS